MRLKLLKVRAMKSTNIFQKVKIKLQTHENEFSSSTQKKNWIGCLVC